MVATRGNGGQRVGAAWLPLAAVAIGAIGCGGSGARGVADGGDGGMEPGDAAHAPDGPSDGQTRSDAPDRDAATGPTIGPGWNALEALISPRFGHTATLLSDGRVLIVGGQDETYDALDTDISSQFKPHTLATAEVHDVDASTVTATGPLTAARYNHTATLLANGKVLIVGGSDGSVSIASAELYDPAARTFAPTGTLNAARQLHSATLLADGKVLIAGGRGTTGAAGDPVPAAELYDPATGTFTSSGSMLSPRYEHTATLLANGKVLIAAGYKFGTAPAMATGELYDPAKGTFSATGSLSVARYNHTATLLPNGKVLIVGGQGDLSSIGAYVDYATAELYDPATGTFSATGSLGTPRLTHSATLLPDGSVLVAGGYNHINGDTYLASAELYQPASGTFTAAAPLIDVRYNHTATALADGRVFLAGGFAGGTVVEIYDPGARAFSARGLSRTSHTATVLTDGRVLFAGGGAYVFGNAALFDPARLDFVPTGQLTGARKANTATRLADGRVFVIGGLDNENTPSLPGEIYSPSSGSFASVGLPVKQRIWHTATLLPDGRVLIAGGGSCQPSNSTEVFDPTAGTFTASGSMAQARGQHTATLLGTGKVLIAGGVNDYASAAVATAELYDPATGTFAPTGTMATSRFGHTATPMPDGRVLIIGGWTGTLVICDGEPGSYQGQATAGAELYDPATGTFSAVGALSHASYDHAAALRSDGTVLVVGGVDLAVPPGYDAVPDSALDRAEIYRPSTKTFAPAGSMRYPRYAPTATTLSTGDVLIVGGNAGAAGPDGNFGLGLVELYR